MWGLLLAVCIAVAIGVLFVIPEPLGIKMPLWILCVLLVISLLGIFTYIFRKRIKTSYLRLRRAINAVFLGYQNLSQALLLRFRLIQFASVHKDITALFNVRIRTLEEMNSMLSDHEKRIAELEKQLKTD